MAGARKHKEGEFARLGVERGRDRESPDRPEFRRRDVREGQTVGQNPNNNVYSIEDRNDPTWTNESGIRLP